MRRCLENGTVEVDPDRDRIDFALFEEARRKGAPVFGICRGLQVVNVALGGTLVQDIPAERPSEVVHARTRDEKTRLDHTVELDPRSRLASLAKSSEVRVNSRHHQAILVDDACPGVVTAISPGDAVPEALEIPGRRWVMGVQWHPEHLSDLDVRAAHAPLFRAFVEACTG